ncbi:MAG: hypothetical protein AAF393_15700 [Pseudomonadota bacterium]
MQRLLLVFCLVLATCGIRDDRPEFEYPSDSRASGVDWPKLAVTNELAKEGTQAAEEAAERAESADRLAARARALEARAARLRRASQ